MFKKYSKKAVIIISLTIMTLLLVGLIGFITSNTKHHYAMSGVLEAEEISVPSLISGPVTKVYCKEGDHVKENAKILEVDPTEAYVKYQNALSAYTIAQANYDILVKGAKPEDIREMKAKLAQAQQKVKLLSSGARKEEVKQLEVKVKAARDALILYKSEYDSAQNLFSHDVITKEKFDSIRQGLENNKATLIAMEEQLKLLKSGARDEQIQIAKQDVTATTAVLHRIRAGATSEEIEIAKSDVDQAKANLTFAEEAKKNATITTPMTGILTDILVKPGELVNSGSAVATVVDPDHLWVRGYIPESKLLYIHMGQRVTLAPKVNKNISFTGTISKIATKATFVPEGGKDSLDQQVFEIKVSVDQRSKDNITLQPGMSVHVIIDF